MKQVQESSDTIPYSPKVPSVPTTLQNLLKTAIPCSEAYFIAAVNNSDKVPEHSFSITSNNASRRVQMWYTPHTLICLHKDKYFLVPTSTVIFANVGI